MDASEFLGGRIFSWETACAHRWPDACAGDRRVRTGRRVRVSLADGEAMREVREGDEVMREVCEDEVVMHEVREGDEVHSR